MHFEIYQQQQRTLSSLSAGLTQGDYRWRLVADNGRIIADSGEGYRNKADCQRGIDLVKKTLAATPVRDSTQLTGLLAAALYGISPNRK